jgi:hypothetical protein
MGKRGFPAWQPTDLELGRIRGYAGCGLTFAQIAVLIGKNERTLENNADCMKAAQDGRVEVLAKIAHNVTTKAMAGDLGACYFYLKTQGRWRETDRHEHTGPDGGAIQLEQAEASADAFTRRLLSYAAARTPAGGTGETEH